MSTGGPGAELSFRELVFSDLARYRPNEKPSWIRLLARCLVLPGLMASVLVRTQQRLFAAGHVRAANVFRTIAVMSTGTDVTPGATFGTGLYLAHPVGVVIGNLATVGNDVTFASGVTVGSRNPDGRGPDGHATIGDGVILSSHAVLLGDVTIGRHALIAANSVVLSDVPDFAIVAGAPARIVGTREVRA
jgi:serine O-acetyltransferase